jgi:F-type H+-transporting ATPase subunit a
MIPRSGYRTTRGFSLLELLVAFIQAYIFTFLSALFIGMALHPH